MLIDGLARHKRAIHAGPVCIADAWPTACNRRDRCRGRTPAKTIGGYRRVTAVPFIARLRAHPAVALEAHLSRLAAGAAHLSAERHVGVDVGHEVAVQRHRGLRVGALSLP